MKSHSTEKYFSMFNEKTGVSIRIACDERGRLCGDDPFKGDFPELLDKKDELKRYAERENDEYYKKAIARARNDAVRKLEREWWNRDTAWIRNDFDDELKYICDNLIPIRESTLYALDYIYRWYEKELFDIVLFGIESFEQSDRQHHPIDELIQALHGELSDETLTKLAAMAIIHSLDYFPYDFIDPLEKTGSHTIIFTRENFDEYFCDGMLCEWRFWEASDYPLMSETISYHYDRILNYTEGMIGESLGDIFERIIGKCYVYFEEYEAVRALMRDAFFTLPS